MSQKKTAQSKHVPQRMCIGCRKTLAKRSLVRVVRGPDGVRIDPSGKASGRGAYVHDRRSCWKKALDRELAQALKTEITPTDREALENHMLRLSPDVDQYADPPLSAGGTG